MNCSHTIDVIVLGGLDEHSRNNICQRVFLTIAGKRINGKNNHLFSLNHHNWWLKHQIKIEKTFITYDYFSGKICHVFFRRATITIIYTTMFIWLDWHRWGMERRWSVWIWGATALNRVTTAMWASSKSNEFVMWMFYDICLYNSNPQENRKVTSI